MLDHFIAFLILVTFITSLPFLYYFIPFAWSEIKRGFFLLSNPNKAYCNKEDFPLPPDVTPASPAPRYSPRSGPSNPQPVEGAGSAVIKDKEESLTEDEVSAIREMLLERAKTFSRSGPTEFKSPPLYRDDLTTPYPKIRMQEKPITAHHYDKGYSRKENKEHIYEGANF